MQVEDGWNADQEGAFSCYGPAYPELSARLQSQPIEKPPCFGQCNPSPLSNPLDQPHPEGSTLQPHFQAPGASHYLKKMMGTGSEPPGLCNELQWVSVFICGWEVALGFQRKGTSPEFSSNSVISAFDFLYTFTHWFPQQVFKSHD